MKNILPLIFCCCFFYVQTITAQNIGIGTTIPVARLHVTDSSVLFSATAGIPAVPGNPPVSGPGRRTMWYSDKAAFRAGYVGSSEWDKANIGNYSFASGFSTTASGFASTAMGEITVASGGTSTAIGFGTVASGLNSFAMGHFTNASNENCIATGFNSISSGYHSTAMGYYATASGSSSVALGFGTTASGNSSTAIGNSTTASGFNSTALGTYVSTSGFTGAFAIGDNSTTTVMQSFVANGFRSRFAGGYRLLTNSAASLGVVLLPDGGSWSAISDIRLKENFLPVDAENILRKIATLPLTTWNYTAQNKKTSRHYGPMAQDFYKAFGHDELGEIGCDTLINQQDFLGINLIAIQALEKRTQRIEILEQRLEAILEANRKLEEQVKKLTQTH
ncbi:MAG TPA: tail fiber domain-containing protein [Ferruginibacter sp.]|nr:tail fiber domain-containing protein [Ferruginibacter sp.]